MATIFDQHSAVNATAGYDDAAGYRKYNFICDSAVNFIANDSEEYSLYINFDAAVGNAGTIVLLPGETLTDMYISCRELYAKGEGGPVPFRAVGY